MKQLEKSVRLPFFRNMFSNSRLTASIISYIFHPVILCVLIPFLVVYRDTHSASYALKWTLFSGMFIVVGLALVVVGRSIGVFSDTDVTIKEERPLFYAIVLVLAMFYALAALFFKGVFFPLSIISVAIIFASLLFDMVNTYTKASVHETTATAFVVACGLLYGLPFFFFLLPIVFLVGWSRILLKHHTLNQLLIGGMLGAIITILTFVIGVNIVK